VVLVVEWLTNGELLVSYINCTEVEMTMEVVLVVVPAEPDTVSTTTFGHSVEMPCPARKRAMRS